MAQTEAASLKASVAAVAIDFESRKYQLQAFKDELARENHIAEKLGQQKYLWQQAAHELQEENQEQKHELKKLKRTIQVWQDDDENGFGELDEGRRQCDELRMNLTQLQENFKQIESCPVSVAFCPQ